MENRFLSNYATEFIRAPYSPIVEFEFAKVANEGKKGYLSPPIITVTLQYDTLSDQDGSGTLNYDLTPIISLVSNRVDEKLYYTGFKVHWMGENVPMALENTYISAIAHINNNKIPLLLETPTINIPQEVNAKEAITISGSWPNADHTAIAINKTNWSQHLGEDFIRKITFDTPGKHEILIAARNTPSESDYGTHHDSKIYEIDVIDNLQGGSIHLDVNVLLESINDYVDFRFKDAEGRMSDIIQLPYKMGGNFGVGKWSVEEINQNMINLGFTADDPDLQSKVSANISKTGMDCSGLVLQVIDKATNGQATDKYKDEINIPTNNVLHWGVGAGDMTQTYAKKIENFSEIQIGDFIRFDNGGHIGIIYEITENTIGYAHSSNHKGPHRGTITVSEAGKIGLDLKQHGTFDDWDSSYSNIIKNLYNYISRADFLLPADALGEPSISIPNQAIVDTPVPISGCWSGADHVTVRVDGRDYSLHNGENFECLIVFEDIGEYVISIVARNTPFTGDPGADRFIREFVINVVDGQQVSPSNVITKTYSMGISFELAVSNEYNAKWGNTYASVMSDGKKFHRADETKIRYYLNPDNFKDDPIYKYQFVRLNDIQGGGITESNIDFVRTGLSEILSECKLSQYTNAYIQAAQESGLALAYLVAHSILETGWGTSKLARGKNKAGDFVGYYNMYGIGAYDNDPVTKGLEKAKLEGWDSGEKAIVGGALWIRDNYAQHSSDRNTLYKMKWNPKNPLKHQYATDIAWAHKQCNTLKRIFELLPNATLTFDIPVYS